MYLILSLLLWTYIGGSKLSRHMSEKSREITNEIRQQHEIKHSEYNQALSSISTSDENKYASIADSIRKRNDESKEKRRIIYQESGEYFRYVFGSRWEELLEEASKSVGYYMLGLDGVFTCIWDLALQINYAQHGKYIHGFYYSSMRDQENRFDKVAEKLGINYLNARDTMFRTIKVIEKCLMESNNGSNNFRISGRYNDSYKHSGIYKMTGYKSNTNNEYICALNLVFPSGWSRDWESQVKDIIE